MIKFDINFIRADNDNFMVHEHEFFGEKVYLIQPIHIGTRWLPDTLNRRSVVVNVEGFIISASFPKFFNWDEQPNIYPVPQNLNGAQLIEKIDGSTLIVSRYKGHTIIRTRGTVNARKLDNGHEIDGLVTKYAQFFVDLEEVETSEWSYLFEWTSPVNKIVIDYGDEPDIRLIAIIQHADYKMLSQGFLDEFAKDYGLKRPKVFNYNSVEEMKQAVELYKGVEGLCVYFNGGQNIRKVKSAEYLVKHRMKSELSNLEKVIDLWFLAGRLPYQEFFSYCERAFDYEIANATRGMISNICDAHKEVEQIVTYMKNFVSPLSPLKRVSRKDAATAIMQAYGQTNRSGMAFKLLDGKQLNDEDYKKLLYQVLK